MAISGEKFTLVINNMEHPQKSNSLDEAVALMMDVHGKKPATSYTIKGQSDDHVYQASDLEGATAQDLIEAFNPVVSVNL